MNLLRSITMLLVMQACCAMANAAGDNCRETRPVLLRVQLAGHEPRQALLTGGPVAGMRMVDAVNGTELWSAGAGAETTQTFAQMSAAFGGSLTAIDLDADGIHDRLYAGDRAGRLWRLDLRAGAPASRWASGGIFADLGSPGIARGFIAAPDIALIANGNVSWLSIAIGSATTGDGVASNRFYVLRDLLAFGAQAPAENNGRIPLQEADLQRLQAPLGTRDLSGPGYYIPLGTSQVLASSLTLDGFIHFTVAETSRRLTGSCPGDAIAIPPSIVSVSVIRADDGAITGDLNDDGRTDHGDLRVSLPRSLPSDAGIELTAPANGEAGNRLACVVDTLQLAGCSVDTSPQRTYWRREDAD